MAINGKKLKNDIVQWIRDWFDKNGKDCNAIVGLSGGKDSSIVAALCVEALGRDRVIGVSIPNSAQCSEETLADNLKVVNEVVKSLGIVCYTIPINVAYTNIAEEICKETNKTELSSQTMINLAPRLRMSVLYAVAQSFNGRVANTSNLSEDWVGYCTRYGDTAGDFAPLNDLTVTEVKEVGYALENLLPKYFVDRTPSDDISGKTDEENFGFTYNDLDNYLLYGICKDNNIRQAIDNKHIANAFKFKPIPRFERK